jgi:DNA polymerase-3 subunit epsilon
MWIEIKRPLVFFDLETTGTSLSADRIVELFYIKLFPDETTEEKRFLLNPKMPIQPGATAIHGYTDADVKDFPTFMDVAQELATTFADCDFAGFNSNKFDYPILVEEFLRVGVEFESDKRMFVDAMRIFHNMEPRNLTAAYKFYCGKDLINAHSAKADVLATYEIIKAQVERYSETLENSIDKLHEFSGQSDSADLAGRVKFNKDKKEIFAFGKHKDKLVSEVFEKEPSYYDWIMNADFSMDTKRVLSKIRLRSFGNKK